MASHSRQFSDKIFDAIEYASLAHHGQFRKGMSLPYIFHPIEVARIVFDAGGAEDQVIAALLHDVVEDTDTKLADIHDAFGAEVAAIVESATTIGLPSRWEQRKEKSLAQYANASPEALLVIFADKLNNLRSIHAEFNKVNEKVWQRFHRGRQQQAWYYHELAMLFRRRTHELAHRDLLDEFEDKVAFLFG
ncbi:MAG: HD domain-containing protein [Chitinivibrionales bacterium]|nr:HD domain-containing protein [Chitinivibrionales bacterium]